MSDQPVLDLEAHPAFAVLANHYRHLNCGQVVDPVDLEDCGNVAAESVRVLLNAGLLADPAEVSRLRTELADAQMAASAEAELVDENAHAYEQVRQERDALRAQVAGYAVRSEAEQRVLDAARAALGPLVAFWDAWQNVAMLDPGIEGPYSGLMTIEDARALDLADDAVEPHIETARRALAAVDALPATPDAVLPKATGGVIAPGQWLNVGEGCDYVDYPAAAPSEETDR